MNNSRGTTFLFFLWPFLISILCLFSATSLVIAEFERTHQYCRNTLLKTESLLEEGIEKLIDLNPTAAKLRLARKEAELKLEASTGTPEIAEAAANLAKVIALQMAFRAQQEKIKLLSIKKATLELRNLKTSFDRNDLGAFSIGTYDSLRTSRVTLALIKRPPSDLTPDFERSDLFSEDQRIKANWKICVTKLLPRWLQLNLPSVPDIEGVCGATIVKKGIKWLPTLKKVKS